MDKLWEDAANLQCALPHVSQDELASFLRRVPLRRSHERCALALLHFLTAKDAEAGDGLDRAVEEDALLIGLVLRDVDYHDVKQRLKVLGNTRDRREVVLRQLLHEKYGSSRKRKEEKPSDETTAIRIKIRRKDGSLEVTSTVTPSSSKQQQANTPMHHLPFEPTEANLVMRDMMSDSDSRQDSDSVNSGQHESESTNTSPSVTPEPRNAYYNDPIPAPNPLPDSRAEENYFDLLAYLKEVTVASQKRIISECQAMHLSLNKRPSDHALDELITRLLSSNEVIELDSEDEPTALAAGSRTNTRNHLFSKLPRPKRLKRQPSCTVTSETKAVEHAGADTMMEVEDSPKPDLLTSPLLLPLHQPEPSTSSVVKASNIPRMAYRRGCKKIYESDEESDNSESAPPSPASPMEAIRAPYSKKQAEDEISFDEPFVPMESVDQALEAFDNLEEAVAREEEQLALEAIEERVNNFEAMPANRINVDEGAARPVDLSPKTGGQDVNTRLDEIAEINRGVEAAVAGPSNLEQPREKRLCQKLVQKIMELFPDARPEFIRDVCKEKKWEQLEEVMNIFLDADYPKRPLKEPSPEREMDADEQFELLQGLLPNADPTFLRMQCEKFTGRADGLKAWAEEAIENHDYPTMKEYLRKQKLSAQQKQYTTEFNVEKFVELFSEPDEFFKNHKITWDDHSVHYAFTYLRNKFDRLHVRTIQDAFRGCNKDLLLAVAKLSKLSKASAMKSRRKQTPLPSVMPNIPLLQLIAYITHEEEIKEYLRSKKTEEQEQRVKAKEDGLLEACGCCYDEEVLPRDIATCPNGCKFCTECIRRSAEVAFGDGKLDFPCLLDCGENFSLHILQRVLMPKMFSKLAQKKALQEVTAAGIEELETCPFCDFATIPAPGDRLFRCLNPDCMKESCRMCREPSHVPLRCEEVEKDEDVKARVFVENQMTEALLRKCWKCGTKFFKEEGCNKMTCSCGAMMCYICSKPVTNYSHFNGIGGDKYHLCPLYSDNIKINEDNVVRAAEEAKRQVDPSKLKVDPAADVHHHYEERKRRVPREPHVQVLADVHFGAPHAPQRGVPPNAPNAHLNANAWRPAMRVPHRRHGHVHFAHVPHVPVNMQIRDEMARVMHMMRHNREMHMEPPHNNGAPPPN